MQNPGDFVREQVTTVRGVVDQLAGSVAETVAAERSKVSATGSQVGEFIREQRSAARVSLRELARTAGVSNPYLSQVERGLRKPSAEILAAIAKGLKISAETLYEQAGILDRRNGNPDTVAAIRADQSLSERHRAVLLELYETYVREHAASVPAPVAPSDPTPSRPAKESA
ncbi:helix-turn-helix domain-containing protein [Geodermatophilus poikilotrophus]|uniref:Transcriptional regulator, contains XRE-family HTH domain n=1 Tax=Geodermatophilus poikilotrophus TaxID=1333667 RepID=A0A1I0HIC0_9ACTN|nr:helix-turn-helix transcriptional regulator [Geodermatophilus poikilotrophus]SET82766.1 Transcriptional regulator, contains XRE-family HTH domain [Geodermatophilus poikilotrophus]